MMINLLPKSNELIEQSIMFDESIRAFGYKAKLLMPASVSLPDYGFQPDVGYDKNHLDVYVSISPHPKLKMLKKLGWNIESGEALLMYISRYMPNGNPVRDVNSNFIEILPTKHTRLTLEYDYQLAGKEFIVTNITSVQFNPIYYTMMVVPYREVIPDEITPYDDNNMTKLEIDEINSKFKFLNKYDN
jgi:hypothetical protein